MCTLALIQHSTYLHWHIYVCYYSSFTHILKCFYGPGKEKISKGSQKELLASRSTIYQNCQLANIYQDKEQLESSQGEKYRGISMTFLLLCFYSSFRVNFTFPFFFLDFVVEFVYHYNFLFILYSSTEAPEWYSCSRVPGCRYALPILVVDTELCLLLQLVLKYHILHQWKWRRSWYFLIVVWHSFS